VRCSLSIVNANVQRFDNDEVSSKHLLRFNGGDWSCGKMEDKKFLLCDSIMKGE
jgi:hypothetical protein